MPQMWRAYPTDRPQVFFLSPTTVLRNRSRLEHRAGRARLAGPTRDPKTHKAMGKDIETQTKQTMNNIRAILKAAGASMSDVVQITIYLRNMKDFERMDKVYRWFFPINPLARTTVQVGLYGKERLVAVDAIAIKTKEAMEFLALL